MKLKRILLSTITTMFCGGAILFCAIAAFKANIIALWFYPIAMTLVYGILMFLIFDE